LNSPGKRSAKKCLNLKKKKMLLHKQPVMPRGFTCASRLVGMKEEGRDLAVFFSGTRANAAGVFTKNKYPGIPVILGREIIKKGHLRAIVVNSKISNVGTGEPGIVNAKRMAAAVAKEFHISENEVIMSSTGMICVQLPIGQIENGIAGISEEMDNDPLKAARGIMTTDTHPKALSVSVANATITLVAKGSGMIEPNMATMLCYIFTDAQIKNPALNQMLRNAVNESFNMLSVDSDTSTSDTCLILANGQAGPVPHDQFEAALKFICIEMAKILARDGEGATKLLIGQVFGAKSKNDARIIAKSIINSPLIKTMIYGTDPNIGRVLMAVGKCVECEIVPEKLEIALNGQVIFRNQQRINFDEHQVRTSLAGDPVSITVNLNIGNGEATAYGCDLTEGYIDENAAYYST
jgi:glutamate N-acetyltransferase/amino-acid N-acetyltransferase